MENQDATNVHKNVLSQIKNGMFDIFVVMLKERKISHLKAIILMSFNFLQIYGTLITNNEFINWQDDIVGNTVVEFFKIVRMTPILLRYNSVNLYWLIWSAISLLILLVPGIICYVIYRSIKKQNYVPWSLDTLSFILFCFYWLFYNPAIELYMSTYLCNDGYHIIERTLECNSWVHIILMVCAILFIVVVFCIMVMIASLYRQSHPDPEDGVAIVENPLLLEMIMYRTFVFLMSSFEERYFGVFIVKYIFMILISILFIYQYIKYFPYFDSYVSTLYGYLMFVHGWVIVVSLLTYVVPFSGHLIMYLTGLIPVFFVVANIRSRLIYELTIKPPELITDELSAIMQCYAINILISSKITQEQEVLLTGMVYLHDKECKDDNCPIHSLNELYDPSIRRVASNENLENLRKNQIYLKHYTKLYFDTAVAKFENSPAIHLAYAFFLFYSLKNIHASLIEFVHAKKLSANLMQSFEIYKFRKLFENYMNEEMQKQRYNYYNITNVIEFEKLLNDLTVSMQKTSEAQSSFWNHLQNPSILDFNLLNEDSEHIYDKVKETEELWKELYEINANYEVAINRYVDYLKNVRNCDSIANTLLNQLKEYQTKQVLETLALDNKTLFDPNTAIFQISGSKDSLGTILKTNQGALNLFSYTSIELLQNPITKIIPNIFACKHNTFMENYFKTGRNRIFNKKRSLFALQKNGYCFQIALFVRPMPCLDNEALQYVGMMSHIQGDADYILTDMNGIIDSMSRGIALKLKLKPKLLHKFGGMKIQTIAPDLIHSYQDINSSRGQKYKKIGGDVLELVVSTNLREILDEIHNSQSKKGSNKIIDNPMEQIFNDVLSKSDLIPVDVHKTEKHIESTFKAKVNCEIRDMMFNLGNNEIYSVRVLKISGIKIINGESEDIALTHDECEETYRETNEVHKELDSKQPIEETKGSNIKKAINENETKGKLVELDITSSRDIPDSFRQLINNASINKMPSNQTPDLSRISEITKEQKQFMVSVTGEQTDNSCSQSSIDNNESQIGSKKRLAMKDSRKEMIFDVPDIETGESMIVPRRESKREKNLFIALMMQQIKERKNRQKLASINVIEEEKTSEDAKDNEEETQELIDEELEQKVDNEEGSISSTSTTMYDVTQANYSIRNAVDEKLIPKSARNMNYMTTFIFLLLLGIAIGYYYSERVSYNEVNKNINVIKYAANRKLALIDLTINIKTLLLIDPRFKLCDFSRYNLNIYGINDLNFIQKANKNIARTAKAIKEAQSQLSFEIRSDNLDLAEKINPSSVKLNCIFANKEMPHTYTYNIWQATLEFLSASLRISNSTINQAYSNYSSMYLINENSLNSMLDALDYSTDGIVDRISNEKTKHMRIYMIMLILASIAVVVSTSVLISVTKVVKRSKEKVLSFFLLLEDAEVKQYKTTCDKFTQLCKNITKIGDNEQEETKKDVAITKTSNNRNARQYKKLSANFVCLMIKIFIFVIVIGGYFVLIYIFSNIFLNRIVNLVNELHLLITRSSARSFLFLIEIEGIMYNNQTTIKYIPAKDFIDNLHESMYIYGEKLLAAFAENKKLHTKLFNKLFDQIVFSNICIHDLYDPDGNLLDREKCEKYQDGILKQGLYTSTTKLQTYLRGLHNEFYNSNRDTAAQKAFFSNDKFNESRMYQFRFEGAADAILVNQLQLDISESFSREFNKILIFFVIYILYLVVLYTIIWRALLSSVIKEFWRSKSILGIIPAKRLMDIQEIKEFILTNSKATFFTKITY